MAKAKRKDKRPKFPGVNASPQKLAEYELKDNAWVARQIEKDRVKNIKFNNDLKLTQATIKRARK